MTRIQTYDRWLEDTRLNLFHPRNPALRALDEAILQYESSRTNGNLWRLHYALEDWKRAEGPRWPASARNRKGAITVLDREIAQIAEAWTRRYLGELSAGSEAQPPTDRIAARMKAGRADSRKLGELRGQHRSASARTA